MPGRHGDGDSQNANEAGTFETLRDEGEYFVHVKQYQKAIESFTKALEMSTGDKNCLVTRSKCWLQLGNAENALTDSEEALREDKDFIRGLYQKAEALYQIGDFETALVFFHRGHKLRPELQELRMGIQKSEEAINNSIGTPESVKLQASGDLSYFFKHEEEEKKKQKELAQQAFSAKSKTSYSDSKAKQSKGTYQKPGAKKETKKERERPKSGGDSKTIKQLLGELYGDKEYLEKLMKDKSLTGEKSPMERDIKHKVYDGLEYLNSRADFWRQQKPMYARKRDKEKSRRSAKQQSRDPRSYILRSLDEIEEDQSEGKYEQSLKKAQKVLKQVEGMSSDELQNRAEIMATLYSSIGNAYLEMNNFNRSMEYHERDLELSREQMRKRKKGKKNKTSGDLEDAKSRALDNLGRVYARKGSFQKAIDVWCEKIPMSKSPLESAWLFHEIGRCHLELNQYIDARDNGRKALEAAKEAEDDTWKLHASVLVAQSEVKNGELQAAASSFEESLQIAKDLEDNVAEQAIKKALDEVNGKIVRGEGDDEEEPDPKTEQRPGTAGSAKIESRPGSTVRIASRTPSPKTKTKNRSRTPSPKEKSKSRRTPSPKGHSKSRRTPSPKGHAKSRRSPSPKDQKKDKKDEQKTEETKEKEQEVAE
ncbi:outer dynein arm-docking complex subunit 4-like isoform X9 [Mytilus californianus]|uniref:outer dynein arm-docking complex subunit 4-like isoform X9 n=1 Tax=Mytilus californianus TaxID=6549 RepID=UPI002247C43F|nr:outer dynein arm-docking complex subunit 4-like isoform X9 [Mytilus californianus]